ncbi:MAG: ABC transporter permease [Treponema sp.]|jgi:putative ABC transport system permease protein|nr:ABC transporter permease [Treponema sp.]
MKAIKLVSLAVRYLSRYKRRYFFLFLALGVGFAVITAITAIKEGMTAMLYRTAQSHYAGDLIALGWDHDGAGSTFRLGQEEIDAILAVAEQNNFNPDRIVMRTNFMSEASLYYNGTMARLKYVNGVDWDGETELFNSFKYEAKPEKRPQGDEEILISSPIAHYLGVRQGDSLILEVRNYLGQRNTGSFVVAGIIEDKTIFGYFKSYVSRAALNELVGFNAGECSSIGFFFDDKRSDIDWNKTLLQWGLVESEVNTAGILQNRSDFEAEQLAEWSGIKVFILTLEIYLSEVDDLLKAMDILSYLLFAMMLIIVFVSALVTYKLILYERSQELGTMRALGFQEGDITWMLVIESACLALISVAVGFLFSIVLVNILSALPFSNIAGFEMFMKDGKLFALYRFETFLLNTLAVFAALLPALGIPAFIASRGSLPKMLSGNGE